jgi:hypothetical protein
VGKTEIDDALKRLDNFTLEEARMVGTRTLGVAYGLENKMEVIRNGEKYVRLFWHGALTLIAKQRQKKWPVGSLQMLLS